MDLYRANTYTLATQVQNGTLEFNTIGNVGATSSALGAPLLAMLQSLWVQRRQPAHCGTLGRPTPARIG